MSHTELTDLLAQASREEHDRAADAAFRRYSQLQWAASQLHGVLPVVSTMPNASAAVRKALRIVKRQLGHAAAQIKALQERPEAAEEE